MTNADEVSEQFQSTISPARPELQTISVTRSPGGKKLRKPIVVAIPKPRSLEEKSLQQYVINAFAIKMPSLILLTFRNKSLLQLARHLKRHTTASEATLYQYTYGVYRYCKWIRQEPDQLIASCKDMDGTPLNKAVARQVQAIDDFVGELQAEKLAPGTVSNHVKGVKALFRVNEIPLHLPYRLSKRVKYKDRSPTPEELQHLLQIADIREKVIITLLCLGGFRVGTLCKLRYSHIRKDLEANRVPLHVHVESAITKGGYGDYDTFLSQEAVEYLRMYLNERRMGSRRGYIQPEEITDDSPLIRDSRYAKPKPISPSRIHDILHTLYERADLIHGRNRRYQVRVHSLRKYFKTQMTALGVNSDYIEYMMGHIIDTYHDVQMKGVEFLRNIYASSGLSVKPRTQVSKIEALKEIIRAWGMNPEEILVKDAMIQPHRTVIDPLRHEESQIRILSQALKESIKQELLAKTV